MEIVYLVVGLAVGIVLGWILASRKLAAMKSGMDMQQIHADELRQTDAHNFESQIVGLKAETSGLNELIVSLRCDNDTLKEEKIFAEAKVRSLTEKLDSQKAEIENLHKQFKDEFENLANRIFKENSLEFGELSAKNLKNLINPLGENISQFRNKVEQFYGDEAKQRFSLQQVIEKLVTENQRISEDANNLTNALKGESKTQGDWGEMILEDILQKSGLSEGEQFIRQDLIRDENGEAMKGEGGHKMQPDVIVLFPDKRKIIIDSKVSLTAYTEYATTSDEKIAKQKLKEHLESVTRHIDELSKKDYSAYMNEAPDFVMMFIPNEPAYSLAIQANNNLWNYAYDRKVVLMNPTNLIMALRLALDLWRRNAQEKNIMAIVKAGSDLYDKFVGFTENFKAIGKALDRANDTYGDAMKQLTTGSGNLVKRAETLKGMGITSKKSLSFNSEEDPS
jgi:DNA recombination protein RmuC